MSSIISGKYQGRKLIVPKKGTRPTSQRVKEAVFSTLNHYGLFDIDALQGSNAMSVLDLYAGSGALGIEAISQGYTKAVFVDSSHEAIKCIKYNLSKDKDILQNNDVVYQQKNVNTFLKEESGKINSIYSLIFIDPPYDIDNEVIEENLKNCVCLLNEESIIVLERSSRGKEIKIPFELEIFNTKKYGETTIYYIQKIVE